ncbi:hypothetical protein A2686_00455 [Candidatus Woesebacteria bacterium RIFCSPHIGHO2_01_FULL_38_10]|nr:MAG: hypothetical protein A2686_00455 [Candidatus Woesebacteria bacterium RIFCSPHIGHO2_01_FULL_38_10]
MTRKQGGKKTNLAGRLREHKTHSRKNLDSTLLPQPQRPGTIRHLVKKSEIIQSQAPFGA